MYKNGYQPRFKKILPALAAIATAALPSVVNAFSQESTNRSNRAMAGDQMNFQERMSNTSHVREVEDLKAAGLNPILSANGGAGVPGGASSTSIAPQVDSGAVMDALRFEQETKLNTATVEKLEAEKNKTQTETQILQPDATKNKWLDKTYNALIGTFQGPKGYDPGQTEEYKNQGYSDNFLNQVNEAHKKPNPSDIPVNSKRNNSKTGESAARNFIK